MLCALAAAQRASRRLRAASLQSAIKRALSEEANQAAAGNPLKPADASSGGVGQRGSFSRSGLLSEREQSAAAGSFSGTTGDFDPAKEPGIASRVFSAIGNTLLASLVAGGAFLSYYQYRYDCSEIEQIVQQSRQQNGSLPQQLWADLLSAYAAKRSQLEAEVKKYSDPPSDHLLPDLPPQVRHVRTLVLDLDDTLVHSDWTRGRGWRTFKRPGADTFLQHLVSHFELVIYTSQLPTYADPILDRLDPHRCIQFRLYRDSTRYINGRHVRDLSMLNRDLNKVLLVTADPHAAALQPDNALQVKPWKLETDDTALLDLLPFLEAVWSTNVPDVRDIVRSYQGQDIPSAFRERMRKLQDANREQKQGRKGFLGSFSR